MFEKTKKVAGVGPLKTFKHLDTDGLELVWGSAMSNHFSEVKVERLWDRIQVSQDEALNVRVGDFDGVVELFQTFFCQVSLEGNKILKGSLLYEVISNHLHFPVFNRTAEIGQIWTN